MKNKKYNIKNIIITILVIILLFASLNLERSYSNPELLLKDLLISINKIFIYPTRASALDQTESYLIQKNINTALETEIVELKKILELNSTHSEFKKINATVISRNNIYWLNALTIDKGKNEGIEEGMAVLTKDGMVGKISKVTKKSSEVKLLTANDITYKTSVIIRINEKDYYAILNGYDEKKQLLKVTAIDKNVNITKGDTVLTSGLGNIPQGLYIGTVEASEIDKYNLSQTVYVKTSQDFNNINYVTILKEN